MLYWTKSTYTFHLSFGEFTFDPISFAAVTRIACAENSIPLDASLHQMTPDGVAYIQTLIEMVPNMKRTHTFKVDSIRTHYTQE